MKHQKLILAVAVAAIAAPTAAAGTDSGTGIPAGRDAVAPAAPLVSEKTAGLWQARQSAAPLVSEKTAGLFPAPQSSTPLVSEKTDGLWRNPQPSTPVFASPGSGFDWSDAGVGAGVMLASLLAASAGAFAIRRRGLLAH
jgi:hypothetical protein